MPRRIIKILTSKNQVKNLQNKINIFTDDSKLIHGHKKSVKRLVKSCDEIGSEEKHCFDLKFFFFGWGTLSP